jgi:hypothetical protein
LYTLNPHTITWLAGDNPAALSRLAVYEGHINASASSGAIPSPETNRISFEQLRESITRFGRKPDTVGELLVSAEERLIQRQLREAVVAVGSALEIASKSFAGRHSAINLSDIYKDKSLSFAMRHYAEIPKRIAGRSLAILQPDVFEQIEAAYRTRNNVAHTGALEYRDTAGHWVTVDRHAVQAFTAAARAAVAWLEHLAPSAAESPTPDC